jgi:hypothetical protein
MLGSAGYGMAQSYPGDQSGGGTTSSSTYGSSDGYSSSTGIAIGAAAAAGIAITYLALRGRGTVKGCVKQGDDGVLLTNEKDKETYILSGQSAAIKPGEHVELKGKKGKDDSGARTFQVSKLVKKNGPCTP